MIGFMDIQPINNEPIEPWKDSIQLQSNVKPLLYDLMFKPQFDLGRFSGRETITVEVTEKTSYFAVHARNINITNSDVSCTVNDEVIMLTAKKTFSFPSHDFWIVEMEEAVKPGTYNINFEFEGSLKNKFGGLFKGSYFNEKTNAWRHVAATKFKPLGAREVYPCFDEPGIKAKYKLRVVRPMDKYVAITNEVIEKEEFGPEKNEVTVFFQETKPMSTFLSGFIVADVKDSAAVNVENKSSKLTIKLYSAPDKIDKTVFVEEIAASVTKFFIDYFEIPFPLAKLDLVAIPEFPVSALEQWGFIIFNDSCLLYDDRLNSIEEKKKAALLVTREVCRQWFGCLVTMKSWHDFWLTEGFVTLMQFKALEEGVKNCRDWKLTEQLVNDIVFPVMDIDAVVNSHPLHVNVENPQYVDSMFDEITYKKSVAVLKMLESFVGKESFRKGIHRFLESFTLSNSTASDLWDCVNAEIDDPDVNVGNVMDTWTKQAGFPVIYAIKRANTWILSQSRFFTDRDAFCNANDSPYKYKWDVPILYITSNDKKPILVWFRRTEECVKITISDRNVSYLKFNHSQTGYYRVNYEGCLWRQFGQLLLQDHTRFDCSDRANLLDDVFHLAEAGQADYHYAFELLRYMEKEQEFLPWAASSRNLKKLLNRLQNTPCFGVLLKLIRSLVGRHYGSAEGQFNWNLSPSDSQLKRLLRIVILELACISKLPECVADLGVKFKEWIKTGIMPVNSDLTRLLLRYGMREVGTLEDWDVVLARYLKGTHGQTKNDLLECLANVREQWAAIGLLEDARNEIRDSDYFLFLEYLADSPYSGDVHWLFIRNEWDYLAERFSSKMRELSDLILFFTRRFNMMSQLEEVQEFYNRHPEVGSETDAKTVAIENIDRNIRFCKRYKDTISSWVSESLNL